MVLAIQYTETFEVTFKALVMFLRENWGEKVAGEFIKETDKTYFVKRFYWGGERRILKDAYDTYAYATKEDAKKHFIRRTNSRISWYEYWTKECEKGLKLIEVIKL